ncbi:fms-related tyrosine kinase 3 ligand isoform X2 [Strigops habroptila]|uniref:fms-related tyrosine kinase 3 ligand isoform X2 n=1 Tax=Strigops habroptila TaxID=2489341 RepID=UPI0011CFACC6|nr:fms-related tyrosine kinase 3 ligand isoform X2 [Strigops habroptila]
MDPAPPGSALVLLLLAVPPPGGCCSFEFSPVSSTFHAHVEASPWLLLDYTVEMPENLELGSLCSDLWTLRFGLAAILRLAARAGGALSPRLRALAAQLHFVTGCPLSDPQGCVRLRPVNVSQLLGALELHLGGLRERHPPPSACARLRCTTAAPPTDPAVSPPPAAPHGVSPPAPHGLVLWGGLGGALALSAAVWVLSARRRGGGQSAGGAMG